MKHIVFVESNNLGILALKSAKLLGYYVSFLRSPHFEHLYIDHEEFPAIIADVDNQLMIDKITDVASICNALSSINKIRKIDVVITLLESVVDPTVIAAHKMGIRSTNIQGVLSSRNKGVMRQALDNKGIPNAKFHTVKNSEDLIVGASSVGFPLVLKPPCGSSSMYVKVIDSLDDLKKCYASYLDYLKELSPIYKTILNENVLLEERLTGDMITLEIGRSNGKYIVFGLSYGDRDVDDDSLELGKTLPASLDKITENTIIDYGKTVCNVLGLDNGIFHLEMILTPNGPIMVEANPRLMGGTGPRLLSIGLGIDIFEYLINIHLGENIKSLPSKPKYYVTTRHLGSKAETIYTNITDFKWLNEYDNHLIEMNFRLKPQQNVNKARSNEDYFGYFAVKAATFNESRNIADSILDRLSKKTSIPLLRRQ